MNQCKKWWPEVSTKPILGASSNLDAAKEMINSVNYYVTIKI